MNNDLNSFADLLYVSALIFGHKEQSGTICIVLAEKIIYRLH